MIRHWLTFCALIVVIPGHFRMESDKSDQMHTANLNLPALNPHARNRPKSFADVTASVGFTGQIVIEHRSGFDESDADAFLSGIDRVLEAMA